ncbi:MAG: Prephenate dehydrogenase [uncultured bacterium (gcode 4)]|uniref:Prephenate dehydrogenase n=1 Tax=uncultured bacterium (gcode 4) TaxID=1234023 RepID=K2GSB8_9BACT|nr:MAG: Prephenate dehydrogenase [uncultured bacterium (gcode 4)]
MKKPIISIIWWTWKFWQFWQKYFESKWLDVIVCWRNWPISAIEAAKKWDIIIFSLSIRHTKNAIKELIPHIGKWKLILDFTWIKQEATTEMKKYQWWEIVWTHPMFWPNVKSLENQNIAFDPIMPWEKWDFIYNLWKADKANLIEMSSKKHDELIWLIQPMTHFVNFVFGHMLKKRWIHPEDLVTISTPVSRMQTFIFSRFLWQQSSLYADMQICNKVYKKEILKELVSFTKQLEEIIQNDDFEAFEQEFEDLKKFIGPEFLEKAMRVSTEIDEIVKKN